jgi:hypothetical protein
MKGPCGPMWLWAENDSQQGNGMSVLQPQGTESLVKSLNDPQDGFFPSQVSRWKHSQLIHLISALLNRELIYAMSGLMAHRTGS